MDLVDGYLSELVEDLEDLDGEAFKESEIRYSVRITESENRRLNYCLSRVGKSRAAFSSDAVRLVLGELEKKLGVMVPDPDLGGYTWTQKYSEEVIFPADSDIQKELGPGFSLPRGKVVNE